MDFYAVLGIPSNADRNTIRNAYLRLVRRYHPDRGHGSSSEKFRQVTEAYETLADAARRSSYDLEFHRSQRPPFSARRTSDSPAVRVSGTAGSVWRRQVSA